MPLNSCQLATRRKEKKEENGREGAANGGWWLSAHVAVTSSFLSQITTLNEGPKLVSEFHFVMPGNGSLDIKEKREELRK